MKKAFLVAICPMTRVIVETNGKTQDEIETEAIEAAVDKMLQNPKDYLMFENFEEIREDVECPATESEPYYFTQANAGCTY